MVCNINCQHLMLLTWKNFIQMRRKLVSTFIMLIITILYPLVLLFVRSQITSTVEKHGPVVEPSFELNVGQEDQSSEVVLAFTPNSTMTRDIVGRAAYFMNKYSSRATGYDTEEYLVEALQGSTEQFGGVVFLDNSFNKKGLSHNITYKIRLRDDGADRLTSNLMPSDLERHGPRQTYNSKSGYFDKGFLRMQRAIDSSIIEELGGNASAMKTFLKKLAFPNYVENLFVTILKSQLASTTTFGFVVIYAAICGEVVNEKQKRLKEFMRLFGLRNWVNWSAWLLKYTFLIGLSSFFITIIYHVKNNGVAVISNTSPVITFLLIFLYSLTSILLFFVVTTLFDKEKIASFVGVTLFFIMYGSEIYLSTKYEYLGTDSKVLISFIPNVAFGLGCRRIIKFEEMDYDAVHSSTEGYRSSDEFTMLQVFEMFIVDILLYATITWYTDAIRPGEFGWPQPIYFPFQLQYWHGNKVIFGHDKLLEEPINYGFRAKYFEPIDPNKKIGIKIRNLTKTFKKGLKPAVAGLNLDICEGHIVALLGHNGAGKTTTMSMLTGFIFPTKGEALINGLSVSQNMDIIRKNMGYCPQVNIHFDNMTVGENLYFFSKLKKPSWENVDSEITGMLSAVSLQNKRNTFSRDLSGGMRRKLSIAIALIGGSKFVILDEPTSGLDPEARREIWDILKSHQHGRTMILSTHYMEEADYLGDKIAIMAEGVLQCYGSSMFLKNTYGTGYQLTIAKTETCDTSKIFESIVNYVPEARSKNIAGTELTYHLPKERSAAFSSLFSKLESDKVALGIESFGVSVTTLEDVFIRVGELCEQNAENKKIDEETLINETFNICDSKSCELTLTNSIGMSDLNKNKGPILILERIFALIHKRFLYSCRNLMISLTQLVLPVALVICICIVNMYALKEFDEEDSVPINLDLTEYDSPVTVYAVTKNASGSRLRECYESVLQRIPGTYLNINYNSSYESEEDMDNFIIKMAKGDILQYRLKYQIATEIGPDYLMGFYNDESYHTVAIALSVIDNAWLQCLANPSIPYEINTINHPVEKFFNHTISSNENTSEMLKFGFSMPVSYGLACLAATFSICLISERKSGAKISQFVSGATSSTFWIATFIWDYINYFIPSLLITIIVVAFHLEGYSHGTNPCLILFCMMLYGWASLPLTYILSFLFSKGSTGFNYISTLYALSGVGTTIALFIVQEFSFHNHKTVEWVFYTLFPNFCITKSLEHIIVNFSHYKSCIFLSQSLPKENMCSERSLFKSKCCPEKCGSDCLANNYLSWFHPGLGKPLLFMTVQGLACFVLLFFIESDVLRNIRRRLSPQVLFVKVETGAESSEDFDDDDVHEERMRVVDTSCQELHLDRNLLVLKQLTKRYGLQTLAVNNLSLKVPLGECFGLLGVNGAGKTSTFKMLTGDETITQGHVYIRGIDVAKSLAKTRKYVGYCPQFDSLIDELTVEEHLILHARLRGIPMRWMKKYVASIMQEVNISKSSKKKTKALSGGNKRKLCIAIAIVGRPKLMFLDEPTTGIDPVAKRELWNLLSLIRQTGSTIILTSHSMEECEALCTRLAIMVNGQFKCLGSIQHLKSKFGSGYSVTLKLVQGQDKELNSSVVTTAKDFISSRFPGSILEYEGDGLLNYRIDKSIPGSSLSNIFGLLENSKDILQLDDYSVGQATLEQIFINFARSQRDPVKEWRIFNLLKRK